jgi:hypothetical protein
VYRIFADIRKPPCCTLKPSEAWELVHELLTALE